MRNIQILSIIILAVLSFNNCTPKIKNSTTVTANIQGNCGMCEKRIEEAGTKKGEATVDWKIKSKTATLVFNPSKTSKEEILKRIAEVGHDNELFKATDSTYNSLQSCCKFKRNETPHDHSAHSHGEKEIFMAAKTEADDMKSKGLNVLYYCYFKIKDGLVVGDFTTTANYAGSMYRAINKIETDSLALKMNEFFETRKSFLEADIQGIANVKNVEEQRSFFSRLSVNLFSLMKFDTNKKATSLFTCKNCNNKNVGYWILKNSESKNNPYAPEEQKFSGKLIQSLFN